MKISWIDKSLVILFMLLVVMAGVSFYLQDIRTLFYNKAPISNVKSDVLSSSITSINPLPSPPPQKLSNPPKIIKAVYVTGYSAGTKKYLNYLTNIFKTTEINSVVIDIKDYSGLVSYDSLAPDVKKYNLYNNAIPDINALVKFFHDKNIYVIGRIAVFEDPGYSKSRPELAIYNKNQTTNLSQPVLWQDNNKLSWMDPSSKEVWDYNISLAKDAFYHGFDEINFDYVRFPTDGNKDSMGFPVYNGKTMKSEIIKEFFNYTRQNLAGEKISVDLFGQTTTNTDDMGIGQVIENAFENFDYISPMVYPSHYIDGFMGFSNPADHPYDIIKYSMSTALTRENSFLKQRQGLPTPIMVPLAKFRPWLQDFNMGADYTSDMVKAEIQATQDSLGADYNGFMLWNPSNIYTQGAIMR